MWTAPSSARDTGAIGASASVEQIPRAQEGRPGVDAEHGAREPGQTHETPKGRAPKKSSDGKFIGRRKVKPKLLAVITESCTGCAGAPVCQPYCPVDDCMLLVPADDAFPYQRIWVDPLKCVGCKKCVSRGPENTFLDGCPWDAIIMVSTASWEAEHGELPY